MRRSERTNIWSRTTTTKQQATQQEAKNTSLSVVVTAVAGCWQQCGAPELVQLRHIYDVLWFKMRGENLADSSSDHQVIDFNMFQYMSQSESWSCLGYLLPSKVSWSHVMFPQGRSDRVASQLLHDTDTDTKHLLINSHSWSFIWTRLWTLWSKSATTRMCWLIHHSWTMSRMKSKKHLRRISGPAREMARSDHFPRPPLRAQVYVHLYLKYAHHTMCVGCCAVLLAIVYII